MLEETAYVYLTVMMIYIETIGNRMKNMDLL